MTINKSIFLIVCYLFCGFGARAQNDRMLYREGVAAEYARFCEEVTYDYQSAINTAVELYHGTYKQQRSQALRYIAWFRGKLLMKAAEEPEKTRQLIHPLLAFYRQQQDTLAQLLIFDMLFTTFYQHSYNDSASFYAVEMVRTAEQFANPHQQAFAYLNLSNTYHASRQHDSVKEYRWKAYTLGQTHGHDDVLADACLGLGQSHLRLSRKRTKAVLDSAIFYLEKGVYHAQKADYPFAQYRNLVVLSDMLNVSSRPWEGLQAIEKAIAMPIEYHDSRYRLITPFYYAVVLKDNGKYNKAMFFLHNFMDSLPKDDYRNRASANFLKTVLYGYMNKPDSMDVALKQAIIARNALSEKKLEGKVAEVETRYETEKKEQRLRELEQEKQILTLNTQKEVAQLEQQRLWLAVLLLIPLLCLAVGGWYVSRRQLRLRLDAQEKERAKQLSELKALRSQMNPHFIFNALNSIQDFILLNDSKQAHHYLGKFAHLMRRFLNASENELIPLEEELVLLKAYIELEALRLNQDFTYTIKVDEKIDIVADELPPMLVQPYLENAFKHGLLHKKGTKHLALAFLEEWQAEERFLKIIITDNGIGREQAKAISQRRIYQHKSFAMQASQQRLALLRKQTGRAIGVTTTDLGKEEWSSGTQVEILFSLEHEVSV